jgi:hypothetical protein
MLDTYLQNEIKRLFRMLEDAITTEASQEHVYMLLGQLIALQNSLYEMEEL